MLSTLMRAILRDQEALELAFREPRKQLSFALLIRKPHGRMLDLVIWLLKNFANS